MSDDLVAELTLKLRNDMGAGLDDVRAEFSGLDATLQQLRDVLGGLTEELQAMRAPTDLADGFAGVVTEADAATTSVQAIGAAIDADVGKVAALKDAWAGYGGTGGFSPDMTMNPPAPSDDDGNFRPSFVAPNTPVPWADDDMGGGGGSGDGGGSGGGRGGGQGGDGSHGSQGGDMVTDMLFEAIAIASGKEAAERYADFDWLLTHIAITEKLSGAAADKEKEFLTGMLDDLATKTGTSSTDLANAYSFLVTTGMNHDLINQLMPGLAETATAYNVPVQDQAQSVFTLSDVMDIGPQQMPQALATLAYAAKLGHFGVADFGHYLPGIGAQLSILGDTGIAGEDQAAAALETVRRVTGTSEEDATDVQDLMNYVTSPIAARFFDRTKRSKDLLGAPILDLFNKYHVPDINIPAFLDDEKADGVDSFDAMVDLAQKIYNPKMTPTDQREIFGALFHNQQAAMGALGLVENYGVFKSDEATLAQVNAGTVTTDYQTASGAPQVGLDKFDEQLSETVRMLGHDVNPTFDLLTIALKVFDGSLTLAGNVFDTITKPLTTAIGTALAYQQHDGLMHYNNPAAPQTMNVHITVGPDGQVIRALQMGSSPPPGVNLTVNQGQVLGAP
jgi:hypothetical protein